MRAIKDECIGGGRLAKVGGYTIRRLLATTLSLVVTVSIFAATQRTTDGGNGPPIIPQKESPIADFTWSPSTPNEGSVVQFIDLSTDADSNIISYLWTFGDGGTSLLKDPSHAYGDDGHYQVTLIVSDGDSLQDSITKTMTISNVHPDVHVNTPLIFALTQGNTTFAIPTIERAENVVAFYNYSSASSHTGFEKEYESKMFLYRDTVSGSLHLFFTHGIDDGPSPMSEVFFDLSGIPTGAYVSQSDDPSHCWDPSRCEEFSLAYPEREGQWMYTHNTDGGILSGLPLDSPWCITITPQHWFAIDRWIYHFANGDAIDLDMTLPVTICHTPPPVGPNIIVVDEGSQVGLSGFFDDSGWEDVHEATWVLDDGTMEFAAFSPSEGFFHHDVEPLFLTYGDDGTYTTCLVAEDSDGGTGNNCVDVVVKNVPPTVSPLALGAIDLGGMILYDALAIDPGSDDLTFTWNWGDGAPGNVSKCYNDGVSADPSSSPKGTYPFSAIDSVTHVYESTGTYAVILRVVDDDGGMTARATSVTVTAPDLIPWDIQVNGKPYTTPVHVMLGSEVDISAKARNLGTSDASNWFHLRDLTTLQSTEIQGLGKGGVSEETLTYRWSATAPGVYRFNITVDSSNNVTEMDENNNWLLVEVVVKGPDLIPEEIETDGVEYTSPIDTTIEERLTFSFKAANIGEHTTGKSFRIALYNKTESTHPFYTQKISELDISERSGRIIVNWVAPPIEGEYSIIIEVDYEDDILELDEENNVAKIRINVKAAPPPPTLSEPEPNYKPLIALVFTLILAILGGFLGSRRPLDISLPLEKGRTSNIERKRLRKETIEEKILILGEKELNTKFSRDRLLTILLLGLPFTITETTMGIFSLLIGILCVPENGTWLSLGLVTNIMVLIVGIVYMILLSRKGYEVLKKEDLRGLGEGMDPPA